MRDKVEAVIAGVKESWGPLKLLPADAAIQCVRTVVTKTTEDSNVRQAIFALFLRGLEQNGVDETAFVELDVIEGIFQHHVEKETVLYLFQGEASHPEQNPMRPGAGDYCEHIAMPPQKALYDDWNDALLEAHQHLEKIVDGAPSNITNCEVTIEMIDDGNLIPLGRWVWDNKTKVIFWLQPERQ